MGTHFNFRNITSESKSISVRQLTWIEILLIFTLGKLAMKNEGQIPFIYIAFALCFGEQITTLIKPNQFLWELLAFISKHLWMRRLPFHLVSCYSFSCVAVFISLPVRKGRDGLKVICIELELEEINGFCRLWFRVLSHKEALEEWSNY